MPKSTAADHSEARERARDEALSLIRNKFGIGGIGWMAYKQSHEAAFEAGRRSLEQERDELRTELLKRGQHGIFCTVHVRVGNDPFVCNCGWEALKAKLAPPVHKGDS